MLKSIIFLQICSMESTWAKKGGFWFWWWKQWHVNVLGYSFLYSHSSRRGLVGHPKTWTLHLFRMGLWWSSQVKNLIKPMCTSCITYLNGILLKFFFWIFSWLLRDPTMQVRTSYGPYLERTDRFLEKLIPIVKDLQFTSNGPIIAVQVCLIVVILSCVLTFCSIFLFHINYKILYFRWKMNMGLLGMKITHAIRTTWSIWWRQWKSWVSKKCSSLPIHQQWHSTGAPLLICP